MLLGSVALFFLAAILIAGFLPSLAMAQQTASPSPSVTTGQITTPPPTPPLTPQEQEEQNRLQSVIAATNQNLDEAEKEVNGIVYTPRWSNPVWVEANSLSILFAYCLPGEFAESGQEILGGFELEVLESYEIALPQGFMAWMMVIGNEDRQDRLPAAVGVVCVSDLNDAQTRVLSTEEQQQINNAVQQFTQVTSIDQVINIINNATTNATGGGTTPSTSLRDTTPPVIQELSFLLGSTSSPTGMTKPYRVLVTDNVDGAATLREDGSLNQDNVGGLIDISCNPPPNTNFPLGNHTVTCRAVDAAGNRGTASFPVTVTGPST